MQSFSEIIEKIKELKGLTKDYEVAELLGIKPKTLGTAKLRNNIPFKKITTFCRNEQIPLEDLLPGGYKDNQTKGPIIKEESGDYLVGDKNKISDAVKRCIYVMESGTSYADALYHNLVHFDRAVKSEISRNKCEEDLLNVNKTLSEMRTRIDEMEKVNKKLKEELKELREQSGGSAPIDLNMVNAAPTGTDDKEM